MKKLLIFLLLFTVLFISSGQTYEEQSLIPTLERILPSKPLEGALSYLQVPYWGHTVSVEERGYYYFIEFLIRKGAHVGIFALIALAVLQLMKRPKPFFAFIITVAIAAFDEYRQSLTGGRTPYIGDVALDAAGAAIALAGWQLVKILKTSRKRHALKS